jgi:hypothetical protein
MVTDRDECPAQKRYTTWFTIMIIHRLPAAFSTLTSAVCCPSAASDMTQHVLAKSALVGPLTDARWRSLTPLLGCDDCRVVAACSGDAGRAVALLASGGWRV